MKRNSRHIELKQRVLAMLLVLAVSELYCGSTLFYHYHVVDNVKVWHSHPFTEAHHSSSQAVYSIAQLNHVVFVDDTARILVEPIEWIRELGHEPVLSQPVFASLEHFNRRGPPVC
ncbi:MAG: hypothetical protein ACI30V_03635 [Muribaculaceae bacterium]